MNLNEVHQAAVQASLDLFLFPLPPSEVFNQLEKLAREMVEERWAVPGEGRYCEIRAQELLLDWIDSK